MSIQTKRLRAKALLNVFLFGTLFTVSVAPLAGSSEGKAVYQQYCQACHQVGGTGVPGAFPPLSNNSNLHNNPAHIAQVIVNGLSGSIEVNGKSYNGMMPAMGYLKNKDIASLVTYIVTDLNSGDELLSEDDVESIR